MKLKINPLLHAFYYFLLAISCISVFLLSFEQYTKVNFYNLKYTNIGIIFVISLLSLISIKFLKDIAKLLRMINSVNNVEVYVAIDCNLKIVRLSNKFRELTGIKEEYIENIEYLNSVFSNEDLQYIRDELNSYEVKSKKILDKRIVIKDSTYNISLVPIVKRRKSETIIIVFSDVTNEYDRILELEKLYQECSHLNTYLSLALDNIDNAVWIKGEDGKIRYCNKYYSELTSQKLDDVSGYKELDKLTKSVTENCIADKSNKLTERYLIVSGKRYLYQFHYNYVPSISSLVCSGYNVSSKDEISQELQKSLSAQSDLLEATSNACAIFGKDRVIKFYNNAFCKLWNIDEIWLNNNPKYEHLLDKLRDDRKLPEYANYSKFRQEQISLFSNLTESQNDFYYLPDGRSLKVVTVPHTFGGLLFSYEDITDKIALESSYNTLLDVQKATIENLHEALCVFAENGRLRLINKTFIKIWKITDDALKSSPYIYELLDHSEGLFKKPADLVSHKQSLLNVFSKKMSVTERIELKDGSVISRLIVPLPDGSTLISDIDITDSVVVEKSLREKNMALQEADKIKTEFLANVSYELRSPLTSIAGLSESLSKHLCGRLNSKQLEYVVGIREATEQLVLLINDVIDLTAIDAGYVELNVSKFNLYKAANSILPLVKSRISSLGLKMIIAADKTIDMIGDETRIRQVIFKLLNNAIDISSRGDEIEIDISLIEEKIFLSVTNTKKSNNVKKINDDGFNKNISLSIIKSFIDLHGGQIEFQKKENSLKILCILKQKNQELLSMYNNYEQENFKNI